MQIQLFRNLPWSASEWLGLIHEPESKQLPLHSLGLYRQQLNYNLVWQNTLPHTAADEKLIDTFANAPIPGKRSERSSCECSARWTRSSTAFNPKYQKKARFYLRYPAHLQPTSYPFWGSGVEMVSLDGVSIESRGSSHLGGCHTQPRWLLLSFSRQGRRVLEVRFIVKVAR